MEEYKSYWDALGMSKVYLLRQRKNHLEKIKGAERRADMTEQENNRVHYLIDACEVRGHLDIKPDDLSLILIHQRKLGKEDALADLAEHDKEVVRKFVEHLRIKHHVDVSENLEWYEKEQKEGENNG